MYKLLLFTILIVNNELYINDDKISRIIGSHSAKSFILSSNKYAYKIMSHSKNNIEDIKLFRMINKYDDRFLPHYYNYSIANKTNFTYNIITPLLEDWNKEYNISTTKLQNKYNRICKKDKLIIMQMPLAKYDLEYYILHYNITLCEYITILLNCMNAINHYQNLTKSFHGDTKLSNFLIYDRNIKIIDLNSKRNLSLVTRIKDYKIFLLSFIHILVKKYI